LDNGLGAGSGITYINQEWCSSLKTEADCGKNPSEIARGGSFRVGTNARFDSCIWITTDGTPRCTAQRISYPCHPLCLGGATDPNTVTQWPSPPPPPPSPSPPARRELGSTPEDNEIHAGRELSNPCEDCTGWPEQYNSLWPQCEISQNIEVCDLGNPTDPLPAGATIASCPTNERGNWIQTSIRCTRTTSSCTCARIVKEVINKDDVAKCVDTPPLWWTTGSGTDERYNWPVPIED